MWIIYALLAALLWAIVNYIDKYIVIFFSTNKNLGALILYSAFVGFPVCFILYLIFGDHLLNIDPLSLVLIIAAGLIYIIALIPYLRAISNDDISSIIPQFMLVPIFGLIFEFMFSSLHISKMETFGATLIIIGVITINLETNEKTNKIFSIKKDTLALMGLSSFLIALNAFLFKFISIEENDFWLSAFWQYFGFSMAGLVIFVFSKKYRNDFINILYKNGSLGIMVNGVGEAVAVLGNLAFYFATLKDALPIVQITAEGFQPLFVFIIGCAITYFEKMRTHNNFNIKKLVGNININKLYIIILMLIGLVFLNV